MSIPTKSLLARWISCLGSALFLAGWAPQSLGATALSLFDQAFVPIPAKEIPTPTPRPDPNYNTYNTSLDGTNALRVTARILPVELSPEIEECKLILSEGGDTQWNETSAFHHLDVVISKNFYGDHVFSVRNKDRSELANAISMVPKMGADRIIQFGIAQIFSGKVSFLLNVDTVLNIDFKYKIRSIFVQQANKYCALEPTKIGNVH